MQTELIKKHIQEPNEEEYQRSCSLPIDFSFKEENTNWKFADAPVSNFNETLQKAKTASSNEIMYDMDIFDIPKRKKRIRKKPRLAPKIFKQPLETDPEQRMSRVEEYFKKYCFESEVEDPVDEKEINVKETPNLYFLDLRTKTEMNSYPNVPLVNLNDYMVSKKLENDPCKIFRCAHCGACFSTKASLGGHVAQKHANESKDYQIRQEVLQTREIERERSTYLRTMGN